MAEVSGLGLTGAAKPEVEPVADLELGPVAQLELKPVSESDYLKALLECL